MVLVRSPSQLATTILARITQSAGACRDPATLRIFRSSSASAGGRACNSFGMTDRLPTSIPPTEAIYTPKEERSISSALSGPVAPVDPRHEHDLAPVRILVGHAAVRLPVGVLRRRLHTGSRHPGDQTLLGRRVGQVQH